MSTQNTITQPLELHKVYMILITMEDKSRMWYNYVLEEEIPPTPILQLLLLGGRIMHAFFLQFTFMY